MNYYLDTEFLEGTQSRRFLGIKYGETKPTIDLISIGLVAEDGREYYAVCNEFNLWEAWNRYDLKEYPDYMKLSTRYKDKKYKEYWIRENVLRPIFRESTVGRTDFPFNYRNMKTVLKIVGKSRQQISKEILNFVYPLTQWQKLHKNSYIERDEFLVLGLGVYADVKDLLAYSTPQIEKPKLYTYFGAYDWTVFCWLFGRMIDLPKGFPMFTHDLKQIQESKMVQKDGKNHYKVQDSPQTLKPIDDIKDHPNYPKQTNEHNALADARWNRDLHEFLNSL